MIGTPGLIKFFWPKDNVETKHTNVYNIPIIDINKKVFNLDPKRDSSFLLLHIKNTVEDS